jgi:hypothetical protein
MSQTGSNFRFRRTLLEDVDWCQRSLHEKVLDPRVSCSRKSQGTVSQQDRIRCRCVVDSVRDITEFGVALFVMVCKCDPPHIASFYPEIYLICAVH